MSCETDTATILRASGQKVTPQRMLILGCVRHASGHITAPQIIREVRLAYPYIDASTVYRTLASTKDLGLVSETRLGSGDSIFEWIGEDRHHHLICRVCGNITSLDDHHLDRLEDALKEETGFEADLGHLAIFGLCKNCAAKSRA